MVSLLLAIHHNLYPQAYRPHPLLGSNWQAEADYFAPTQVKDTTMEYGFAGGNFRFHFPLYLGKDWLSADGGRPFIGFLANAGVSARQTQMNYLKPNRLLTNPRLGFTALMATGPSSLRNLYLLQASFSMPSESFQFDPGFIRPHGTLLWRKLYHNNRLWHTLGLTYTGITGKNLLLPVLGAGYKLGNDDQVQFLFPFNVAYTHMFSKKLSMSVKANMQGSYYYLDSDTSDNSPLFRQRFLRISVLARYYTDRFVVLIPEAGLTTEGQLRLDGRKDSQLNSVYFKFSLQVRFGKRPAASPIMNFDPGDSGYDPNYIVE